MDKKQSTNSENCFSLGQSSQQAHIFFFRIDRSEENCFYHNGAMYGKVSKTNLENGDEICHKGVGGWVRKYDWKCIQTQNIFVHHKNSSFFLLNLA